MLLDLDIRKTLVSHARQFTLQVRFSSSSARIVILGPSGSGKSLTLKAVAGLMRPDSGHIRLDGATLFDHAAGIDIPARQRRVAYLFQDYALFPHLTVRQNIGFGLVPGWLNPRRNAVLERVEHWLDTFQLRTVADQYPDEISGGQSQRTALARALISEPRALLLDEPFSALDPSLRTAMRDELDDLQHSLQVPMILITHDQEDAAVFGDDVVVLDEGRIRAPAEAASA